MSDPVTNDRLLEHLPKVSDEARRFRLDRVARIIEGATPLRLRPGLHTILHIVPDTAFDVGGHLQTEISAFHKRGYLQPVFSTSAFAFRHDSKGFLIHSALADSDSVGSYLQIFSTGALESVNTLPRFDARNRRKQVPSLDFELHLLKAIPRYFTVMAALGIKSPVLVGLSLIGIGGYSMEVPVTSELYRSGQRVNIRSDTLFLPEIVAESFVQDPAELLKPSFDAIWKAAGWDGSIFYDGTEWVGLAKPSSREPEN